MSPGNGSGARPDHHFFDPHQFYVDFTRELRRMRHAYYPERDFFTALRRAELRDVARSVASANAADDDQYFARQHVYEADFFDERDRKWLDGRWVRLNRHGAAAS
ncbi:MAG: hypothetical protein WB586_07325 [Chthoniobacterales bacterium]